jgi:hypothetical protein
MSIIINIERLTIYRKFGGDENGFTIAGTRSEREAFDDNIHSWSITSNKTQDLELIKNGFASQEYIDKTINELRLICDAESYAELTKTLNL